MIRLVSGCLRRLLVLALLAGGASAAWYYRHAIVGVFEDVRGTSRASAVPGPALAEEVHGRLALLSGSRPSRVAFSEAELQSLLDYRIAAYLPSFITAPRVELDGGRIRLHARISTDQLSRRIDLGEIAELLPDTTPIVVTGQLIPLDGDRVGLAVDEITAARIPVPRAAIPSLLRRFGREDEPGLPADAIALPLPTGAAAAYVRGDSLVFVPR